MPQPYATPIEVATGASALSNLGATWDECWSGLLAGSRRFGPGSAHYPGWPESAPVAAITQFGASHQQPAFSVRFEVLLRQLAGGVRSQVDAVLAQHPQTRCALFMASSAGDPGPLATMVDRACRSDGHGEPVTLAHHRAVLGSPWSCAAEEALGRWMPSTAIYGACASALVALTQACDLVSLGRADVVVVLSLDTLSRVATAGFANIGASSSVGAMPYDRARDGTTVGEGGVGLVLCRAGLLPGASVRGRISGAAVYCDAAHLVEPNPAGVASVVSSALDQARVSPRDLSAVYWHGTGTRQNDKTEAAVSELVFGGMSPPCTSTKGSLGHTMGASGAFNVLAATESFASGLVPPVVGTSEPEFSNLDLVLGEPRAVRRGPILITALGFGGINAAVVVEAPR